MGLLLLIFSLKKKQKSELIPVNILYIPMKKEDGVIKCYFTDDLKNAYRALYLKSSQARTPNTLYECFYCNEFWIGKSRFEKHIRVCGKKPGVVKKHCDL